LALKLAPEFITLNAVAQEIVKTRLSERLWRDEYKITSVSSDRNYY